MQRHARAAGCPGGQCGFGEVGLAKTSGDTTFYIFKCAVAAKEMASDIKAQIIDGSKTGTEYTYSHLFR